MPSWRSDARLPPRLPSFYLFVSLGGLVGGAFVALLAPLLFNAVLEYPLGLVLAALLLPYSNRRIKRGDLVLASFIGALVLGGGPLAKGLGLPLPLIVVAGVMAAVAVLVLSRQVRPRAFALCIAALLLGAVRAPVARQHRMERAQFLRRIPGSRKTQDPATRSLVHGTTNHGGQWMSGPHEVKPTTYHTPASPVAEVIRRTQARATTQRVALVGLGSGALAYYRRPGGRVALFLKSTR